MIIPYQILSLLNSVGIEIFLQPLDFDLGWPPMMSPDVQVPGSKESDLVVKTSSEPQSSALGRSPVWPDLVAPLFVPKANTRETLASRDLSQRSMRMETLQCMENLRRLRTYRRIAKVQKPRLFLDTT